MLKTDVFDLYRINMFFTDTTTGMLRKIQKVFGFGPELHI